MSTILEPIFGTLARIVEPLENSFSHEDQFNLFLLRFGWKANVGPGDLNAINTAFALQPLISNVIADLDELIGGTTQDRFEASMRLLESTKTAVERISSLSGTSGAGLVAPLDQADFWSEIAENLLADLVALYLKKKQPILFSILHIGGVIRFERENPTGTNRVPFTRTILDWSQLGTVLTSPGDAFNDLYRWDVAGGSLEHDRLFRAVEKSLLAFGMPAAVQPPRPDFTTDFLTPGSLSTHEINELELPIVDGVSAADMSYWKIGAAILPIPDPTGSTAAPSGFAIRPLLQGQLQTRIPFTRDIGLTLSGAFDTDRSVTALIYPTGARIEGNAGGAQIAAAMEIAGNPDQPWLLIGDRAGTRLELGGFVVGMGIEGTLTAPDIRLKAGTADGENGGLRFVLMLGESDGFINKLAGQDSFEVDFSGVLNWSSRDGFSFEGQAGLEIALALHLALGPVELDTLYISVRGETFDGQGGAKADIGVGITGNLGPITAVVENIGLSTKFVTVPEGEAGTFGNLDVDVGFKPPNGVGLAINAGVVSGGGYLFFDHDKGEYAGALEISIAEIVTVKAIGLINTQLPDGSDGFSLLVIISAEFQPIQLGFGFTLNGLGGLLGLNRTMRLEVLAEGVRSGAIESVMFPDNIIANAPQIISDLRSFFPPEEGTFLIGPMAKIGWGTPTLATLSMGVIIEIPPGNIAIIGVLKVALPDEDAALIVLQVNFIGALEVDKGRLWFFASLYGSRVLFITLDGEMGLLVAWGEEANFVVSVGGFHPSFSPPALPFPNPKRIALTILNTSFARIRVEGYFAVTSNTVQFGAAVEVYFGLSAFNIDGHIAFDALFQFSPFYFIVTLSASFSVKVFGAGLFSVRMRGELEGPTPWHIEGKGEISLLFWDLDVPFSHTWGESAQTALPPISVVPLLAEELRKDSNWIAKVPSANSLLVSLRELHETDDLVLHPVGALQFSQRVVPLDFKLEKFGAQVPDDAERLALRVSDADLQGTSEIQEDFATAQFKAMNDSQKLSLPAFEKQEAGMELSVAGAATRVDRAVRRIVRYEVEIIDTALRRKKLPGWVAQITTLFANFLTGSAIARASISERNKRLKNPHDIAIAIAPTQFVIASMRDNSPLHQTRSFTSKAKAIEAMQRDIAMDPSLSGETHVIPASEMKLAA